MGNLNRRQFLGSVLATGVAAATASKVLAKDSSETVREAFPGAKSSPRLTGIRRVIVDTDPGNDDALALLVALDAPSLSVESITVCPGNLGPNYGQQVKNALYMVALAGKAGKVPVHAGITRPLLNRPYPVATFIHGAYGLGGFEAPEVAQKVDGEHAVEAIHRLASTYPGEITILALGGLSNVATVLLRYPEVARLLKGILFVGGRYASPGLPPSYNVLVDPEAAHIVFTAGIPMTLVGADVIRTDSILNDGDFERIASFGTARSRFFIASNDLRRTFEKSHRGTTGSTNPDSIAVAAAIYPDLVNAYMPIHASVELQGELTRGLLVYGNTIYSSEPPPAPNVEIALQASHERFKELIFSTLRRS